MRAARRGRRVAASACLLAAAASVCVAFQVPGADGAFVATITNSSDTAGTAAYFTCSSYATDGTAGRPYFDFSLSNASAAGTATDASGNGRTGTYSATGVTSTSNNTVCPRDKLGTVSTFNGATGYVAGPGTAITPPNVFTLEVWFRSSAANGYLIGFGSSAPPTLSSSRDRMLYIGTDGKLYFGVFPNAVTVITTPSAVTDNQWHLVDATLSSSGMALYLDGKLVATNSSVTTGASTYTGYWRIGYEALANWTGGSTTDFFNGSMAWAAEYNYALSATQVAAHYVAGR